MTSPIDPIRNAALDSCPFCKREPAITQRAAGDREGFACFIACMCGGYSARAHQYGYGLTPEEALSEATTRWNTRALPVSAGEPVGYVSPRTMAALKTPEGSGPVVSCPGYDTVIPVYAAPQPVAWDASHNRSHPQVEKRAREIYDKLLGAADYPWIDGGNSIIQDKCRDQARSELRAATPSFETNDGGGNG